MTMAAVGSHPGRLRGLISPSSVFFAVLLAAAVLIIFCPLAGLFTELCRFFLSGKGLSAVAGLFTEQKVVLLLQTIGLATAVTLAGTGTGILVATALWRRNRTILVGTLLLVFALAPIPPYIHALTWSSAITLFNRGLFFVGAAPVPVTGWLISFWVQFMALLPIAIFLAWIGLASVDRTLIEAARMMRSDSEVLREIILPLAAPTLIAASGFLFILTCTDYSVPSLFGCSTYALDIFSVYSATGSAGAAMVSALPLLFITLTVLLTCRTGIRRLAQAPNWTVAVWDNPPVFSKPVKVLQKGALILLVFQTAVIFMGLASASGDLIKISSTLAFSMHEIKNSLIIVACVVIFAIPLTLAISRELLRPGLRGSLWWGLILFPIAVPAPLIGIGIITLWNNSFLPDIYGTFLMPVFAALSRFAPFAAIILYVQIRSIDPALFDAARIFSRSTIATVQKIIIPLLAPGIFIASALLAALTMGELGATLVVTPPGFETLALKIYNYLHYGAAAEVAGLCLVMAIVTLCAGICIAAAAMWRGVLIKTVRNETEVTNNDRTL